MQFIFTQFDCNVDEYNDGGDNENNQHETQENYANRQ